MPDAAERFLLINPDGAQFGPADLATLRQWAVDGRIPVNARLRPEAGGPEIVASDHPTLSAHLTVPPVAVGAPPLVGSAPVPDSGLTSLIPTRNPPALAGYYLGVFGLIPCMGTPLALAAIVCGIIGLVIAGRRPESKGKAHAITAICLGSLSIVGHIAFFGLLNVFG